MRYTQKEVNLHTHTFYSGHAKGKAEDYLGSARESGRIKVLGFSEHSPKRGFNFDNIRPGESYSWMNYSDLENYTNDIRALQEKTTDIKILLGSECEWSREEDSFFREELLGRLGYDYLILGIHFIYDDMGKHYIGSYPEIRHHLSYYVDTYTKGLETGLFKIGCHPDLFAAGFPVWDADARAASNDIIQCARDLDIPLEINGYGFRKKKIGDRRPYSVDEFWEQARDSGVRICTNSDAHRPEDTYYPHVIDYAEEMGIRLVDWELEGTDIRPV